MERQTESWAAVSCVSVLAWVLILKQKPPVMRKYSETNAIKAWVRHTRTHREISWYNIDMILQTHNFISNIVIRFDNQIWISKSQQMFRLLSFDKDWNISQQQQQFDFILQVWPAQRIFTNNNPTNSRSSVCQICPEWTLLTNWSIKDLWQSFLRARSSASELLLTEHRRVICLSVLRSASQSQLSRKQQIVRLQHHCQEWDVSFLSHLCSDRMHSMEFFNW